MDDVSISVDATLAHVDDAARIWAEATAARDGDDEIATLDEARPVIARVLALPASFLLIARLDGAVAGFAAVSRVDAGPDMAEIHYLGVRPSAGGKGIARALLAALPDELRLRGLREALLKVYADNTRAVLVYEAAGWRRHGEPAVHPRSGRLENEYRLIV